MGCDCHAENGYSCYNGIDTSFPIKALMLQNGTRAKLISCCLTEIASHVMLAYIIIYVLCLMFVIFTQKSLTEMN